LAIAALVDSRSNEGSSGCQDINELSKKVVI